MIFRNSFHDTPVYKCTYMIKRKSIIPEQMSESRENYISNDLFVEKIIVPDISNIYKYIYICDYLNKIRRTLLSFIYL